MPAFAAYLPGRHGKQNGLFSLSWYNPSGQELQDAAPGLSEKNPAEQLSQMNLRPVALLAKPAGQSRQKSPIVFPKLLFRAYLPAPQAVHFCWHGVALQFDGDAATDP